MKTAAWNPDFGTTWNPKTGASAVGVRDLLIAFNVNIKGGTLEIAKEIAEKLRETGFLAKSPKDWLKYLKLLIENEDLRTTIGQNAQTYILENREISKVWQKWEKTYGLEK